MYYVREKVKFIHIQTIIPVDEILSVAMVQIAIRVYSEGNYWDYFDEEVGVKISQGKKYYFAQIFAKTIQKYQLFELEQENPSKYSYVENIKAHAFVPNKYLHNYFDFLFSFYGKGVINAELNKNVVPFVTHQTGEFNKGQFYFLQDEGLIPK